MTNRQTVAQAIYTALAAKATLMEKLDEAGERSALTQLWIGRWTERLDQLKCYLPVGMGFDNGTTILDEFAPDRLNLQTSFHHMNDHGSYVHWSDYDIIVKSTFDGLTVKVQGFRHNPRITREHREYVAESMLFALTQTAPQMPWEACYDGVEWVKHADNFWRPNERLSWFSVNGERVQLFLNHYVRQDPSAGKPRWIACDGAYINHHDTQHEALGHISSAMAQYLKFLC